MSPAGDALHKRCLSLPTMLSATVVDWFQPWPTEALRSVASTLLAVCAWETKCSAIGIFQEQVLVGVRGASSPSMGPQAERTIKYRTLFGTQLSV